MNVIAISLRISVLGYCIEGFNDGAFGWKKRIKYAQFQIIGASSEQGIVTTGSNIFSYDFREVEGVHHYLKNEDLNSLGYLQ